MSHIIVSFITLFLLVQLPMLIADPQLPRSDSGKPQPQPTAQTEPRGLSVWLEGVANAIIDRVTEIVMPDAADEQLDIAHVKQTLRKLERHAAIPRPHESSDSAATAFRSDVTKAARSRESDQLQRANTYEERSIALAAMVNSLLVQNIDADNAEELRADCGMTDEDAAARAIEMNKNI